MVVVAVAVVVAVVSLLQDVAPVAIFSLLLPTTTIS